MLCERIINTNDFAGRVDMITGIEDFESEVIYNSEWHCYRLGDKILPSVTQLLEDDEYNNVDEEILEYARIKGNIVHKEIQDYLEQQKKGFTSEFEEFLRLFTENKELFLKKAIFDIKTYSQASPKKRKKCYKQCKMYADGVKHLTNEDIEDYYMIWLPHNKKGKIIDLREEFE